MEAQMVKSIAQDQKGMVCHSKDHWVFQNKAPKVTDTVSPRSWSRSWT